MSEGIKRVASRLRDFDAIADAAKDWDLDFRLLGRGRGSGEIETVATQRAAVQRNRFPWKLLQRGASPRGCLTFGIGVEATQELSWCGQMARDDFLVSFPADGEYESGSDESFHVYTLTFDTELVHEVARILGQSDGAVSLPSTGVFRASWERASAIREIVARILGTSRERGSSDSPRGLTRAIEYELLVELLAALSIGRRAKSPGPKLRALALRRSRDFVDAAAGRRVTVRELCEATGVSWRTLDYAFKERYGVTPKAFLRARRLNAVRRQLQDPESADTVSRAAGRWGFWHLSQFAADYRRLFGELPSETLRSVRGRGNVPQP